MEVLYARVLDLLDREREHLILFDFENLYPCMREKDEILSALRALDRDRLRIQDNFAAVMDLNASTLSLKDMAELIREQGGDAAVEADRLLRLRARLQTVIGALTAKVGRNSKFLTLSIGHLQTVATNVTSLLAGKQTDSGKKRPNTYTGKARLAQPTEARGGLVQKRF